MTTLPPVLYIFLHIVELRWTKTLCCSRVALHFPVVCRPVGEEHFLEIFSWLRVRYIIKAIRIQLVLEPLYIMLWGLGSTLKPVLRIGPSFKKSARLCRKYWRQRPFSSESLFNNYFLSIIEHLSYFWSVLRSIWELNHISWPWHRDTLIILVLIFSLDIKRILTFSTITARDFGTCLTSIEHKSLHF
jgi:hypothetical protein